MSGPVSRISRLLAGALTQMDKGPAYFQVKEALSVSEGLDPYLESMSSGLFVPSTHSKPEAVVKAVWNQLLDLTEKTDWKKIYQEGKTQWELHAGMCSGAYEAGVLQQLALNGRSKRILEIGVLTGTTTLAFALLPEVEKVVGLEIEGFLEEFDRPFWEQAGVSDKIDLVIGPALDSLKELEANRTEPFDFVFIDANKPDYKAYVNTILDLGLLAPEGVIYADNTLFKSYPYTASADTVTPSDNTHSNNRTAAEAIQGIVDFNQAVVSNPDLFVSVLPIRDGISIIRRK